MTTIYVDNEGQSLIFGEFRFWSAQGADSATASSFRVFGQGREQYFYGQFDYTNTETLYSSALTAISIRDQIRNLPLISIGGIENLTLRDYEEVSLGTETGRYIYQDLLLGGSDTLRGSNFNDRMMGYASGDTMYGKYGDDWLHGNHGADFINGGAGNDTIRGGHGPDTLIGDVGADWIWGGIGANTIDAGAGQSDLWADEIFVPVDSINNLEYGNPGGANADTLLNLGAEDKIYIHGEGITNSSLTFGSTSLGIYDGIGIYANGTLEALVTGGFSAEQVQGMTTGGFFA